MIQTGILRSAMFTPLLAAGYLSRPRHPDELTGAQRTEMGARVDSTIVRPASTVAASAPAAQDAWEDPSPDFLSHLERRLGVGPEAALSTLGEALLCYEPKQRR
jgi:hypothetical protein